MIEVIVRVRGQDANVVVTHPDNSQEQTTVQGQTSSGIVQRTFILDDDDTFEVNAP